MLFSLFVFGVTRLYCSSGVGGCGWARFLRRGWDRRRIDVKTKTFKVRLTDCGELAAVPVWPVACSLNKAPQTLKTHDRAPQHEKPASVLCVCTCTRSCKDHATNNQLACILYSTMNVLRLWIIPNSNISVFFIRFIFWNLDDELDPWKQNEKVTGSSSRK